MLTWVFFLVTIPYCIYCFTVTLFSLKKDIITEINWQKGTELFSSFFFSFWLRCTYYVGVATLRHHNRFHGCFSITHVSHTFTSNIMRRHLTCTYTNTQNHLFFSQSLKKKSKRAYHTRSLVRDIIRYPVESVEIMNLTSCITGMGCFRDMRDACRNNISFLY